LNTENAVFDAANAFFVARNAKFQTLSAVPLADLFAAGVIYLLWAKPVR
jgi:hypothetical protein